MAAAISSLLTYISPPKPGKSEDNPLELKAVPGLTTLLDLALFRSNEGQLTATICSSHALLACWLDIKRQSQLLLDHLVHSEVDSPPKVLCESFARQCLECSMDAIERLSTDKFAQSANLSDPFESISSVTGGYHTSTSVLSGVGIQGITAGVLESKEETGRRAPIQKRKDCWESPRLFCPDHVWADDSYSASQRWIRNLGKHPYVVKDADALAPLGGVGGGKDIGLLARNNQLLSHTSERQASMLIQLIQEDLPMRLYHFRQAMDAEAVVTKRLYLVKSEYRAPFRAFLEGHQTLWRAPHVELVESYLQARSRTNNKDEPGAELQKLLKAPALIELLALERETEQIELDIGETLFPFSELARSLDHKKARLKTVRGVLKKDQLPVLQETIRRLKCILCRKGGSETSTGIRPILLDLQGVARDDLLTPSHPIEPPSPALLESHINEFLHQLECLSTLVKTKNAFWTTKLNVNPNSNHHNHHNNDYVDVSLSIVKGCTEQFDVELLKCQLLDWFAMVERQQDLQSQNPNLPDQIRQAEMKMSIAGASHQSLEMVKERLKKMQSDRQQRLEVLKELLEDLCLREMHLYVRLTGPDPTQSLILQETSALGFLGIPLQMAGEILPVG